MKRKGNIYTSIVDNNNIKKAILYANQKYARK